MSGAPYLDPKIWASRSARPHSRIGNIRPPSPYKLSSRKELPLNDPTHQPERRSYGFVFFGPEGLRAGWGLLLFLALLAVLLFWAHWTANLLHPPSTAHKGSGPHEQAPVSLFLAEGTSFIAVLLATWIMSRIEHRPATIYGLGGGSKLPHFLAGLGWGAAFLSLLVLVLKLTGLLAFDTRLLFGAAAWHYGMVWLFGFLLVALLEETLLRGYLQYTLARGLTGIYDALHAPRSRAMGFWTAAFLLSLVFGLGHGSNPGESPIGLLSAALAGLVFCLALWRTGSLWWAIGFHTSWDWAQSFLYGVADSGTMVQFHVFRTHPVGRPLLSGGATGPEGSLYIVPVLALAAFVILLTLGKPQPAPENEHRSTLAI